MEIPAALSNTLDTESAQAPTAPETQEAPQAFACPACTAAFGVLASMFGTTMACPHCGQAVAIEHAPSPAPKIDVKKSSTAKENGALESLAASRDKKAAGKKRRPTKSKAAPNPPTRPAVADDQSDERTKVAAPPTPSDVPPAKEDVAVVVTDALKRVDPQEEAAVESFVAVDSSVAVEEFAIFVPQNVDHLLPPRFATLDPAFFYRRGKQQEQVLLPQADGGVQAVNNRIVTIIHNGREHQLISSPRYRRNLDIIVNTVLMLIAALLMMAIWWAVA